MKTSPAAPPAMLSVMDLPSAAFGTEGRDHASMLRRAVLVSIAFCVDNDLPVRVSSIARCWSIREHRVDDVLSWLRIHGLLRLGPGPDGTATG